MHNIKQHLAKIESKHLIIACAITVALAIIVIITTILLVARVQAPAAGTQVRLSGEIVCLPHKNTGGPQTLECAYGLHTDDNRYFALLYTTLPDQTNPGGRVEVMGTLTAGSSSVYDIAGTIKIDSISN